MNLGAEALGLRIGQALADAQAILPDLALHPADPAGDAAYLHRLALRCLRLTPLPAIDPPDGLLLDITGIAHLHGGEAAFAQRLPGPRWAIAGTAGAASALARGAPGTILTTGEEAAALAPLPLAALRLPPDTIAALSRLGLRRIGEVLAQPRGPLARRFGAGLLAALDAATGARTVPIDPVRPTPELDAAIDLLEPIITRAAIDAVLDRLLGTLCARLAAAGHGARRFRLLAFRVDGEVQEITIGTGLPARDPRHIARLFREDLERLAPGFGFDRMALEAPVTEPLGAAQTRLAGPGGASTEARQQALAELLDRLAQRVPVQRLAPRASHWPERAVERVGPFAPIPAPPPGWLARIRPVRLLRRPIPMTALALLPDGPPRLLRQGGMAWTVARAEGPERIAPEWWRETRPDRASRDYYRVELTGGRRLWVCRADLGWWLHGHLP